MTISSEINKSGPYKGNGVSTQFDFDFKIEQAAHLHVIRTSLDGVETVLVENDYQVSLDADRTGSVKLSEPLPTGEKLTLLLNPPFTQLVDLPNQGAWNPEVLESALDKLTSCLLKLREEVSRAVKIKASNDLADLDDLLADIEALADVASDVKSLAGVKADIAACAANIAAILSADDEASNAASSAQTAANLRDEVANMKQLVETAKDQAIAARDAAQAANPISASDKGRELVGKETASEMRDVLGVASGVPVGSIIDWPVDVVPAFWARADGAAFSRATYSDLHDALAPELNVAITSGSAVVTGLGSAQGFKIGMALEGAEIPKGTTVQSVDGANQITLSANATANGTKCRVYRYGNGDGSTTFNLPNFEGRVSRTWDPSGVINPDETGLGVSQEDAIADIGGSFAIGLNGSGGRSGAFAVTSLSGSSRANADVNDTSSFGFEFDPSLVTNVSTETRAKSLIVNKIIKVFGGVDDAAILAASSALTDIAAAVAKADEVERVSKNWVENFASSPLLLGSVATAELLPLATTITNVKAGNAVEISLALSYESIHNRTFFIMRNGVEILSAPADGSCMVGLLPLAHDNNQDSTMSHVSICITDKAPSAGSNTYTVHTRAPSSGTFALNRTMSGANDPDYERTVSVLKLQEKIQ